VGPLHTKRDAMEAVLKTKGLGLCPKFVCVRYRRVVFGIGQRI
jgi:hypothetical protein